MKPEIMGAYTVLVTPFNQQGQLDEEGLRKNIRFQLANAIDGLVALGTTGEDPTLTHSEKEQILKIARQETLGKCHLMVGTGSFSTQETIENTLEAQNARANSVLVIVPYYNRPTQEGFYRHFSSLAKAVKIPIVIYNNPIRTGQNLQTDTLKRLAAIDNIVGVKEASGSIVQMMEVIENIHPFRPDFSVMSGDDAFTYPLITLGGHGIYSILGNLFPQQMKNLCDTALNGDYESAREMHYQLLPYMRGMFIETNPIPIKAALNLSGHAAGPCRLPLCEMSKENHEKLKRLLEAARVEPILLGW
jgi:4-hydroxy-tetrahydrodipicolinate synthase